MLNEFDDFIVKLGVSADNLAGAAVQETSGSSAGSAEQAASDAGDGGGDDPSPASPSRTNQSSSPAAKPTIAVRASGTTFTVTGSGFLASSSVSVRTTQILPGQVVDLRTPTNSDTNGKIAVNIAGPNVCAVVGPIFFSATDGREDKSDILGVLFSNTVEMSCLPLAPDNPDDPDDPDQPDQPDQPTPTPQDPSSSED